MVAASATKILRVSNSVVVFGDIFECVSVVICPPFDVSLIRCAHFFKHYSVRFLLFLTNRSAVFNDKAKVYILRPFKIS